MAALDQNGEYGDIGWIDPGNARGLSQVFGTIFFQLFATFKSNGQAFVIIKPLRNLNRLICLCPFSEFFLLLDVRGIMTHNHYLFVNGTQI